MSFLTYTSHPVLFATSVGGVTIGVALLLLPWKNMSFGNLSFHSPSKTPLQLTSGEGNCQVTNDFQEFMRKLNLSSSHVAMFCGLGKKDDNFFTKEWVALFPKKFFIEEVNRLSTSHKINIFTDTDDSSIMNGENVLHETIFESRWFLPNNRIIGRWDYEEPILFKDWTFYPIQIVSPENSRNTEFIYLQLLGR